MSLLLCHECYSWVEPSDGRCPDCWQPVDTSVPDPPLRALKTVIGELICPLGEIKVRRKMLPDRGMLYATTQGLYFLPHRLVRVMQLVETEDARTSFFWFLAAIAWTPLMFLLPLLKSVQAKPAQVDVFQPQFLTPAESHLLPEFLMQNPGVFFVPRESVRTIRRRRNTWTISRWRGSPLKLKPQDPANASGAGFHERMSDFVTWEQSHGRLICGNL